MKLYDIIALLLLVLGIILMVLHFINDIGIIFGTLAVGVGTTINTISILKRKDRSDL